MVVLWLVAAVEREERRSAARCSRSGSSRVACDPVSRVIWNACCVTGRGGCSEGCTPCACATRLDAMLRMGINDRGLCVGAKCGGFFWWSVGLGCGLGAGSCDADGGAVVAVVCRTRLAARRPIAAMLLRWRGCSVGGGAGGEASAFFGSRESRTFCPHVTGTAGNRGIACFCDAMSRLLASPPCLAMTADYFARPWGLVLSCGSLMWREDGGGLTIRTCESRDV